MKKIINTISVFSLVFLSSCSLFSGKGLFLKGDQGEATTPSSQISQEKSTALETVPPQPEPVVQEPSKKTHTESKPQTSTSALSKAIDGEWTIVQVSKLDIKRDDDMPYINFDMRDNRFYASNGCNVLNGDFTLLNNKELTFSNVISTMKACPDIPFQTAINSVIQNGNRVQIKIESKGQESYLLFYRAGTKLMTLRRHNMEKLNGEWIVTKIGDNEIENNEVNIFFDIPELLVHGNTGCNFFNGIIFIDSSEANSISFSQMGVSMKQCENSNVEMAFLVALEETTCYHLSDKNTLYLNNDSGHHLLTLKRAGNQ